ncbi:MAG: hypothetical protein AYK18_06760 [Theionarchaea archaeon DG-70]|nr:MAG: hypothetical protein AYK18_06760 [Theionarchaea archaeon DG-70]
MRVSVMSVLPEELVRKMLFIFQHSVLNSPRVLPAKLARKAIISRRTARKYLEQYVEDRIGTRKFRKSVYGFHNYIVFLPAYAIIVPQKMHLQKYLIGAELLDEDGEKSFYVLMKRGRG